MATVAGIEYYPFNVDFFDDDKIALIESEFGAKGSVIAIRLLCKIYREGYYYRWGDDACLIFARKSGADFAPNMVKEVVSGLVRRSFFDKGMFDKFGILTSRGIQQRYFEAVKRRQKVEVNSEYLLVDTTKYPNIKIVNPATVPAALAEVAKKKATVPASGEKDAIAAEVQKLNQSQYWLESVAMRFHLTIDQIKEHLEAFAIDCRSRGTDSHENIQDAQRHFNDWLRIQLNIQNSPNNGTEKQTAADRRRSAKGVASKTEDFSTTF